MPHTETNLIEAESEVWPLKEPFVIARGAKTEARVARRARDRRAPRGRGECVPYARYGETIEGVLELLRGLDGPLDRRRLGILLPPGAARNALDCALWDLEAKRAGRRAGELAGLPEPRAARDLLHAEPRRRPTRMAAAARRRAASQAAEAQARRRRRRRAHARRARGAARRAARRRRQRGLDAATCWRRSSLPPPRPASSSSSSRCRPDADEALAGIAHPVPICADESAHTSADIAALGGRYDAVNIKLDKTGGLTEALAMAARRARRGFRDHGRLDGGDVARHGAGVAARPGRRLGRPRRAAAARRATATHGPRHRGRLDPSAAAGAVGLDGAASTGSGHSNPPFQRLQHATAAAQPMTRDRRRQQIAPPPPARVERSRRQRRRMPSTRPAAIMA